MTFYKFFYLSKQNVIAPEHTKLFHNRLHKETYRSLVVGFNRTIQNRSVMNFLVYPFTKHDFFLLFFTKLFQSDFLVRKLRHIQLTKILILSLDSGSKDEQLNIQ